jgi:uncharacterized membrane protein
MENRPRIKLKLSSLDKTLEITSKVFLIVLWGLTLFAFLKSPMSIPTHFNASGKADVYGNKMTLLILPILATIIYFGLTRLNKYPHIFNYLKKITVDNAERQYSIATRLMRCMKLAILLIFSLIILFSYLTTIGAANGLGFWFLPLTEGLLTIPPVIAIIESLKK